MSFNESKIEWTDFTWNPISGCAHGCPYCYARRITQRFAPSIDEKPIEQPTRAFDSKGVMCYETEHAIMLQSGRPTPYPKGFSPTFHKYLLDEPSKSITPRRVFVCSMGDLFGDWVPDEWIEQVFAACQKAPQHTYMFLTKYPQRYCDLANSGRLPLAPNFWYGTTITGPDMPFFFWDKANTFVSVEPLLEPFSADATGDENPFERVGWVIIGAMTGPRSKHHQPKREWVEAIVRKAREAGTAVFMKDSLKPIWGEELIQELPEGMQDFPKGKVTIPHCKECEHREETPQGRRGTAISCQIGWDTMGYDDRPARHVPGRYSRTSPPWCPKRRGGK